MGHSMRRFGTLTMTALLLGLSAAASAQVVEVRGGVTTAPVLGFGGVRIESTPTAARPITFGCSIDVGGGLHRATFFTITPANFWLGKAHPSLEFKSWSPRVAVGLSFLVARDLAPFHGGDEIGGYWSLIVGAEHRSRLSVEVQLNFFGGAPRAYFVVGYRIH